MKNRVIEAIEYFSMLDGVKNVTVALSGGADSMALLNVLISLKEQLGISVNAAHLNHMIRGEEAMRDEDFVKQYCEEKGIEIFCKRENVPEYATQNGMSIELAARKLRYQFLEEVNNGVVATAHTASDNLETMIFNLARGTAIDGLCGIPPKRDIFIRPIINCTRSDIEKYCFDNSIPYVTDSSNLSDDYTRNKIRHSVIPVLKQINPSVEDAALRTAFLLREQSRETEEFANEYISENKNDNGLNLCGFSKLTTSVAKSVIKKYIAFINRDISLSNFHIENVYNISLGGGKCSLPQNFSAISDKNTLKISDNNLKNQVNTEFKVEIFEKDAIFLEKSEKINNLLLKNSLDCDNIIGKLVVRVRKPGDKIRLKNRGCTKTLNQLYNENHIPVELREKNPVISDDLGVIWIHGIGVAHRVAVGQKTKRIYEINVVGKEG